MRHVSDDVSPTCSFPMSLHFFEFLNRVTVIFLCRKYSTGWLIACNLLTKILGKNELEIIFNFVIKSRITRAMLHLLACSSSSLLRSPLSLCSQTQAKKYFIVTIGNRVHFSKVLLVFTMLTSAALFGFVIIFICTVHSSFEL